MGMYNYLICEYPLPNDAPAWARETESFQTKDLEPNVMATIKLSADGKLIAVRDGVFDSSVDVPSDFNGDIFFCDGYGDPNGDGWQFVEFRARFVYGKCREIKTVEGAV